MKTQTVTLMGEAAKPLVITSINPYGDVEWQKACVESFISTGHDVISFNIDEEATKLEALGFKVKIRTITTEQTGFTNYDKPVPLINEVLRLAYQSTIRPYYILTNSDIFYAGNRPCNEFAHSVAEAFAFTRVDVINNIHNPKASWKTYRGGLDVFGFTRDGLADCLQILSKYKQVASLMAYGIPGWDFLMGSIVLGNLNGYCMDGTIYHHKIHPQTNTSPAALLPYVETINNIGYTNAASSEEAAHQFACKIESECIKKLSFSKLLRTAFYTPNHHKKRSLTAHGDLQHISGDSGDCSAYNSASILLSECYQQSDIIKIHDLMKTISQNTNHYYPAIRDTFVLSDSNAIKIRKHILIASLYLSTMARKTSIYFTDIYPSGNCHHAALEAISKITDPFNLAYQYTQLFYSELLEYRIYNRNVAKFILAHLDDARYRHIMCLQFDLINRHFHHA